MGAFSSFTLGYKGACGGLGLELAGPANQNVYIGLQADKEDIFEMMPFFGDYSNDKQRFDSNENFVQSSRIKFFQQDRIKRDFRLCTDIWSAGDLTCAIYSPVESIPDPVNSSGNALKSAILPAVFVELTVDNTKGESDRRAIFGYQGNDPYSFMRHISQDYQGDRLKGIGQGRITAVCTDDKDALSGLAFSIDDLAFFQNRENLKFGLGPVGAIIMTAPAGHKVSWKIVICFFRDGIVTSGIDTSYLYTKYFRSIEEVASFGLKHFDDYRKVAFQANKIIDDTSLSSERKFMMAHAIRSYYGSTQLMVKDDKPIWMVNEGEYRMINTLDLTVDQVFYEIKMNPWTVKNVLDTYCDRFSYQDTVRFPGDKTEYPGGLSFTHDMGVANNFSGPGYSVYELTGLDKCFSYMTQEQLVNWILCAAVYSVETKDMKWLIGKEEILKSCLHSMMNRDHYDPTKLDGIMDMDCSRVIDGAEITTYDNVDSSIGRARRNAYVAVKCWASYLALQYMFDMLGKNELVKNAANQAGLCADTICIHIREDGTIPALLENDNQTVLISVIEGLVYPWVFNKKMVEESGPYGHLINALKTHYKTVLNSGRCLFEDKGWRLSSTSDNSWLSKSYLCQFITEKIFGFGADTAADKAHLSWLLDSENSYFAWSDQMRNGKICGSRYYPRGVTSILWLEN